MQDKPRLGKTVLAEQNKWRKVAQFRPNAQNLWHFPKKSLDIRQQDTIQWLFLNEKARQGVFLQQVTSKILEESRHIPNAAHLSFLPTP